MKTFTYEQPTDVATAVVALQQPGAQPLAGGTNLVDLMKLGIARPDILVDVNRLGLSQVDSVGGGLMIGAGVRNSDLAAHPDVRRDFPMLAQALVSAASGQLRNMASTGGNLLQRTRCVYFMDSTKPCNKKVLGSGCPARDGLSRDLAVLGGSSSCIATAPGDMAVAMAALDAVVHIEDPDGAATMTFDEFYRLPGEDPRRDTNLPTGSLITAVGIPAAPVAAHSLYRKARDRASYAFALGSVAAALTVRDGVVADVRLAYGGAAPVPWRARQAEEALIGQPATAESFAAAADAELAAATPTEANSFKIPLLQRLTVGALLELSEGQS